MEITFKKSLKEEVVDDKGNQLLLSDLYKNYEFLKMFNQFFPLVPHTKEITINDKKVECSFMFGNYFYDFVALFIKREKVYKVLENFKNIKFYLDEEKFDKKTKNIMFLFDKDKDIRIQIGYAEIYNFTSKFSKIVYNKGSFFFLQNFLPDKNGMRIFSKMEINKDVSFTIEPNLFWLNYSFLDGFERYVISKGKDLFSYKLLREKINLPQIFNIHSVKYSHYTGELSVVFKNKETKKYSYVIVHFTESLY